MNSRFKIWALAAFLVLGGAAFLRAETEPSRLFETVADNDKVYGQLRLLADAGILDASDAVAPLTRYDVAKRIQKARVKYDAIVVAMTAADVPPPPEDDKKLPEAGKAPEASANASEAEAAEVVVPEPKEISIEDAASTLHSLEEAYQFELKVLKDRIQALKDKTDDLEAQQYATRKKVKSLLYAPKAALHGVGRAFASSSQYSKSAPDAVKGVRDTNGYLDIAPDGVVSKELFWAACFRFESTFLPDTNSQMTLRHLGVRFNPPWFSMSVGDFEEAYTPLTLWNRNTLDLQFAPDMIARQDKTAKYEGYLDREPAWPFRGVKIGTELMWPDSKILDGVSASAFAHMIRNGFDDSTSGGWYLGSHQWSEWVFAGTVGVKSAKWWLGEKYLQASVNGYGTLLNQMLGTDTPGSSYDEHDPDTWAHSYRVGSVKPDVKLAWGNGSAMGLESEFAFSEYHDDIRVKSEKTVSDYAAFGGPYVQMGDSKLTLRYLNVGPYYYSPLAQTRQDAVTSTSVVPFPSSSTMVQLPLRTQNFLTGLSRPSGLFTYYDRTLDNTFPYGLSTPNRRGFGGELDVATLKDNALKVKGSAYWVEQITADLTFNSTQTAYVPVDDPDGTIAAPKRKFVYINVGPSYDLGPALHLNRLVEVGSDVRFERTDSSIGRLNSLLVLVSLRVGIFKFWEISTAATQLKANGTESGMDGTTWARYSYLYDNQDLGRYTAVAVDNKVRSVRISNNFHLNNHADLFLDWAWTDVKSLLTSMGTTRLIDQYVGLTYEVRF